MVTIVLGRAALLLPACSTLLHLGRNIPRTSLLLRLAVTFLCLQPPTQNAVSRYMRGSLVCNDKAFKIWPGPVFKAYYLLLKRQDLILSTQIFGVYLRVITLMAHGASCVELALGKPSAHSPHSSPPLSKRMIFLASRITFLLNQLGQAAGG
ncbi:unnamed protein product [Diplocarpon coronariae]